MMRMSLTGSYLKYVVPPSYVELMEYAYNLHVTLLDGDESSFADLVRLRCESGFDNDSHFNKYANYRNLFNDILERSKAELSSIGSWSRDNYADDILAYVNYAHKPDSIV